MDTGGDKICPLHVRSGYSLLRGPAGLEELVSRARELGHERLALTDVNNLYGATLFHKLASASGLRPIIGAELMEGPHSVIALVESDLGYENLCRLITRVVRRAERSEALFRDLAELSEGLAFVVSDERDAECLLAEGAGRERLWLGVDPATQRRAELRRLSDCGGRLGLRLVATGKALMAAGDQRDVARLLAAIRRGETFDTVAAEHLPHARAVLRTGRRLRGELDQLPEAIRNNQRLAERCADFKLLPRRPVFPSFPVPDGLTPEGYLRRLCRAGLAGRYGKATAAVRRRLEKELLLIEAKGFCEYFLVVHDVVQYARRRGAPVAGRGSGASSLVAYLLGITNVCPVAYDIPFERFLNEQREDFPDLDVDFCWRIRDEVIEYAFRRWGEDHVAMVSTHNTFQPRSAVRETAKAFGLADDQISGFIEAVPAAMCESEDRAGPKAHAPRTFGGLPEKASQRIMTLSRRILHLPGNLSVHPGGIVIGRKTIDCYVPIQTAAKGVKITQYDKDGVEDVALVKLDLLGNRGLSTIRHACKLVAEHRGRRIDVDSMPTSDPRTIELLRSGRTVGCNQLESPAMRHLLKMMQPGDVRDVMKILALIRPGSASLGMKEAFIRRHRGLARVPPAPAGVEAALRGTCGVMLYEDDVMLVAAAMLGCSRARADRFRREVQKCRTDARRLELSREFLARCAENGVDTEYAKSMWVQMAKFNAYSFCRAHAASYAMLSYAGAYLKTHWPLEFWTAALNNNQSMYHLRVYVEQAKRDGVRFLLPDVNRSEGEFSIERTDGGGVIRVGLNLVEGLGPAGVAEILRARQDGPFEDLGDFLRRTRLADEQARSLILCGAFDGLARSRPALMMELNILSRLVRSRGRARPGDCPALLRAGPVVPAVPGDYGPMRKYLDQRKILGITIGRHLMSLYRPFLAGRVDADSRDIASRRGRRLRVAGLLEARRTTRSQGRRMMTFLTLDDEYGLFEVTLFSGLARRCNCSFLCYGPYVVAGKVEDQYGSLSIAAEGVEYVNVTDGQLRRLRD